MRAAYPAALMGRRGKDRRASLEPLVAVEEAAAFLGVQTGTVYLWAETGRIPSYKIGVLRRFRVSDLEAHLQACRSGPPDGPSDWRPPTREDDTTRWEDPPRRDSE